MEQVKRINGYGKAVVTLHAQGYDTVVFDMNGVIAHSNALHASAWKRSFDGFLRQHANTWSVVAFDINQDYARHFYGRPAHEGLTRFLRSRGIDLPVGGNADPVYAATVHALAKRKRRIFLRLLQRVGVKVNETGVGFALTIKQTGLKTALVSSSRHCAEILHAARLKGLFDVIVDGNDLRTGSLKGKPEPDMFLEACRRLGSNPSRSIAIDTAVFGVRAARRGKFACVIGVDRGGNSAALHSNGADLVINDLAGVRIERA